MTYTTTVTSKGTVTIAAPLRKALNIQPGQKVRLSLNRNHQVVLDAGTDMADFERLRAEITSKIPSHKKGLAGEALKEAAAKAWASGYNE